MERKSAFPQHLLKCNSSSMHHCDACLQKPPLNTALAPLPAPRLFKSSPFSPADLGRGCTAWSGPPYSCIHSVSQSPQHRISSGSTPGLLPKEDFHAKVTQLWALRAPGSAHSSGGRHSSRDSLYNHRTKYARN